MSQSSATIDGMNFVTMGCVTSGDFCTTNLQHGTCETVGADSSERCCDGKPTFVFVQQIALAQQADLAQQVAR